MRVKCLAGGILKEKGQLVQRENLVEEVKKLLESGPKQE